MAVQRWRIDGFQGDRQTLPSRHVLAGENEVRELLRRLAARHLTDDEVIEAMFGSRKDFEITMNTGGQEYGLMTTGTDYFYTASVEP